MIILRSIRLVFVCEYSCVVVEGIQACAFACVAVHVGHTCGGGNLPGEIRHCHLVWLVNWTYGKADAGVPE